MFTRTKIILTATIIFIGLSARCAWAWGPVPFSPPALEPTTPAPASPHPKATECDINDLGCIKEHDDRALMVAFTMHHIDACQLSTTPEKCIDEAKMIEGDVPLPSDPLLLDGCTIVVRISGQRSWLYSYREKRSITRITRSEWPEVLSTARKEKRPAFIGACDIDDLASSTVNDNTERGVRMLSSFPW